MIKINFKNIIILSIFILFFSISSVCASELNQNDFQTADIDDKTFSDLEIEINNCSSGDTISLNNDYYFNENYTVEGINISKNLTIEGNGHIIDALNKSRIFNINNESTIILNNIIFKNGYASDGAAIKFSQICEDCKIINCVFENNVAEAEGGAIHYSQNVANNEIINTTFTNNMAKNGGAINFEGDLYTSIFDNNIFINNSVSSDYSGGAINLNSTSYNNIFDGLNFINNSATYGGSICFTLVCFNNTISNSNFFNNSAESGAGIYMWDIFDECILKNLNFENNFASKSGAAISSKSMYNTSFLNLLFLNNTARTGGAFNILGKLEYDNLENLTFINNSAKNNGGAIFFYEGSHLTNFNNIRFINNTALNGPAIYINMHFINNTVTNNDFINNTAEKNGGAIYSAYPFSFNVFEKCNFIENTAQNASAIYNLYESVENIYNNCNFINNTAKDSGLIYLSSISTNKYTNSNFINNTAKNFGGLVYLKMNECPIDNCTFINNIADLTSDLSYIAPSFGSVVNSTFSGKNHVYIAKESNITFIENIELNDFNKKNYFIINDGILSLQNNTLSNFIVNNGDIITQTSIIVLNNETVNTTSPNVILYGECVDDNGNTIIGDYLTFDINGSVFKTFFNGNQIVKTEYLLDNMGCYTINATITPNLSNCTYKTGIINFKSKKSANINASDIQSRTGEYIELNVNLDENATGTVIVEIDNKTYIGIADNGNALIIMAPLTAGIYEAYITYSGDENYDCDTCKAIINVSSKINIDAKDVVKYYKGPERFIVNITQDTKAVSNKSVEITINGVSYKRTTDENGIASIALNLESGEYEVITLVDDEKIISQVTIKSTINSTDLVKIFRNDTQFLLTCVDSEGNPLKNSTVTFNIHGVFYNRTTDNNGVAKLNINLEPGEYIITTINTVTGEMKANKIIVLTQFIEHGDLIKKYGDATPYTIRLVAKDGSIAGEGCKVTFNINGVFYTRTSNSTGHVSLNINLQQGQYIITSVYMDEMISDKITVY